MKFVDHKCLEALLIEDYDIATEGRIAEMLLSAIGRGNLYQKRETEKAKAKANKAFADKQKAEKEAAKKALYEKYNLNDPKAKEDFKKLLMKDIDSKIKKMVNVANKNAKLFEETKKKILDRYDNDESECRDLLKVLKPGYFKAEYDGDYYLIIEDQEIACVCDLHCDIVEALRCISDDRYQFASFSYGDGDEGCVYVDIII